jgi:alkanesulfonate monooxygenase SsuD/methylene tetrahydromethanopterin reductase-like flavin-dependent oxidoreductase (luciferase family)
VSRPKLWPVFALIRKLWEQPVVDHEDSDHRIDRAGILPRPKRQIPVWLRGFSEAAFDRAARIGDGFLFSGRTQTEAIQIKAGSRPSCSSVEGMPMHSASRPSSNTVAGTTNGLATLRRGAKLAGATYLS